MDLIVFGGQSNMQGQSECLSENDVVKDAYEYKWLTDEVVPLKNPVGEDITYEETCGSVFSEETDQADWLQKHVTGSACFGHTNLVPAFCRAYTQISGRNVTAVHIAKGSTVIADWLPGSRGYEILVKKAAAARKKVNPDRVFFVWLQGESDAIFKSTAGYYKEALNRFCDALKKEIQEYVKTHTAPYKYPRIVEFVDELPKTISGKVRRVEIRKNDLKKMNE